ncbi:MAG: hypothetical protein HXY40_18225 [Chloroflexi bacterium]|nr:hypothetical protein [Chloroflexota bacterium]
MRRFLSSPQTWLLAALLALFVLASYASWAAPAQQASLFERDLLDTRNDLEFLASQILGVGQRPPNWTSNSDLASPTALVDLWFDNELLADAQFGAGTRPEDWIGATTRNPQLLLRNIRHDLELTASAFYQEGDSRPQEWRGSALIIRCSRSLQNLWLMLGQFYNTRPATPESALDYCRALEQEADAAVANAIFGADEPQPAFRDLIWAIRGDLERLADERLGLNNRPSSWIGNRDIESPTLASDIYFDLETLADALLGLDERPENWIGFINNSLYIANRNLRHDIELLANATQPGGTRPNGWQGTDPLMQCTPDQQNLIRVAQIQYSNIVLPGASPDFCRQAAAAANNVVENPPVLDVASATAEGESRFLAESQYAFAYLDAAALQYMGVMPFGTIFRAWYRNFGESTMMFVSGEDFAVYIDRRWTSMTQETFEQLPSLEGVRPLTFCDAAWCNGPGPTPTPTGSGPLEQLVFASTPLATIPSEADISSQLTRVSWNYIRVTYLLDNPTTNTAQVALEICAEPAQIACEPVTRVFNNNTGVEVTAISQFNGLNVYEFAYGYTTNVVIQGETYFSPDIWISDPTIR